MDKALELLGDHHSIVARPVAVYTDSFVLLQCSKYEEAFVRALEAQRLTHRYLGVFMLTSKAFPLAVEAGLGPRWHDPAAHSKITANKGRMKAVSRVLWKCLAMEALFVVARAHCYRVRARYAFVTGKIRKARRLIDRAIAAAEKQGSPYELARALLDRSLINPATAAADREKGQALLAELHSVLPEAERAALERRLE
jgi:hypothetical protein